jgi:hydroxymethylpyrimidine/phosphomethylpyrimidine kinase
LVTDAVPNVLTIAGSDPSGGAGLQGDLKTFAAFRVHGCAVPTALTAQNSLGVRETFRVPADFVVRQLDVLLDDIEVHAVKIGMLGNAAIVAGVCDVLRRRRLPNIVLDPVLNASLGGALLDESGLAAMRRELLPMVTVTTPNADEAGVLLGVRAPTTESEAASAAQALCAQGVQAALVTGGHLSTTSECVDVLCEGGRTHRFRAARVNGGGAHGTGCALSSAIAALLARGWLLADACGAAQAFVAEAVDARAQLNVGHGTGPLNPLHRLWRSDH